MLEAANHKAGKAATNFSSLLEVFHQPNVELVSVKDNPIERITPEGLRLGDGSSMRSTC